MEKGNWHISFLANIDHKSISLKILRIFCKHFASSNSEPFKFFLGSINKFGDEDNPKKIQVLPNILKIIVHKNDKYSYLLITASTEKMEFYIKTKIDQNV